VRAILFSAILASAMSSLDSALNSLSASTMRDFVKPRMKDSKSVLLLSKLTTVAWGALVTGFAFLVGQISETVIESINKIGSAFYGPILAAFLVGVLSKRASSTGVTAGLLAGVGLNLVLWLAVPSIHWMWWNCFGCVTTIFVSLAVSLAGSSPGARDVGPYVLQGSSLLREERRRVPVYLSLLVYFVLILCALLLLGGS
jgi:SSS family solute:Na+ symporter